MRLRNVSYPRCGDRRFASRYYVEMRENSASASVMQLPAATGGCGFDGLIDMPLATFEPKMAAAMGGNDIELASSIVVGRISNMSDLMMLISPKVTRSDK